MKLVIEGNTWDEIKEKILDMAATFFCHDNRNTVSHLPTPTLETPPPTPKKSKDKKKSAPSTAVEKAPTAVTTPEVSKASDAVSIPMTDSVQKSVSKEVVTAALIKVSEKIKLEGAQELLAKFGAKRLGELPEDKYEEFHKACLEVTGE